MQATYDQQIRRQEACMNEATKRLHTSQLSLQRSVAALHINQQRLELKLDIATAAQVASIAESEARKKVNHARTPTDSARRLSYTPPMRITAPLVIEACTNNCICICHRRKAHHISGRLLNFVGALFLGYSGVPVITPTCDSTACVVRSSPMLLFMYIFPTWMLARAFFFIARLSLSRGLELNIRLPCIIHISSDIWKFAHNGDIENLKGLFERRKVTPYDMEGDTGYTALGVRSEHDGPGV